MSQFIIYFIIFCFLLTHAFIINPYAYYQFVCLKFLYIFSAQSSYGFASGQDKKIGKYYFQTFLIDIVTFDSKYILFRIFSSQIETSYTLAIFIDTCKFFSDSLIRKTDLRFLYLKKIIIFKEYTENCHLIQHRFQTRQS